MILQFIYTQIIETCSIQVFHSNKSAVHLYFTSGGKSAVVTALVVGLGGKASVTSRGSKLKGFIKTGKQ